MSQAWIVVGTPENFEVLRQRKFDIAAFKSSRQKQSSEMRPGDRLVYYLTGQVQFGGVVEVTGEAYEDSADMGLASEGKEDEDFPFRIATKPVVIAEPGQELEVREITDLLDKTRKFGPKKLGMCFRGNLHRITDSDLKVIEGLLEEQQC
ncbi:MAG: EVE domain-containing protein [Chloroflexi bacterium]|nr:EVE domain-containing protein [Chloroflexota bacterium]